MENRVLLSVGMTEQEHDSLRRVITDQPHVELEAVESAGDALERCRERTVSCVVTGHTLPDSTGAELLDAIRRRYPTVGRILCADSSQTPLTTSAELLGVELVPRDSDRESTRLAQLVRVTLERQAQTSYPVPSSEHARLEALAGYTFDDERLTESLQRLTELAASHFEMPLSSVNVVHEHTLESIACYGMAPDTFCKEEVVCTYAIAREGPTVIEDLSSDGRFATMDSVEQYDIRFYAGATLTTEDGYALGTFCVYDREPRSFSAGDRHALELYATEATAWIEQFGRSTADHTADAPAEGSP